MKESNFNVLDEYVRRLKKEALIKAALCALAVSFAVILLTALACWLTEFSGYWIFAIAFAVPFGAAMPLFYFFVFYPTKKYVAKRLDQLGLDERILTMVEFENQESYIMQRQRQDAVATLSKFNSKLVKVALSAALIAVPAITISTAVAMTSVYALSEAEVIPSGKDLIEEMNRDKTAFDLVYQVPDTQKGCGVLYSASNPQGAEAITLKVGKGQDGEVVIPVAAKGYVFVRWSDGVGDVTRCDTSVQGKIVVTAIFEELDLEFSDNKKEDGAPLQNLGRDSDPTNPSEPSPPSDNDKDKDPNEKPNEAVTNMNNQYVFDGQTDYGGAPFQDAHETSTSELSQSGGADGDSKGVAGDYFEAITKN